ncbi:MAG: hypothetical protein ACLT74_02655 [Christensenellales bacterium]
MGSTLSLTANFVEADTDTRSYSKRNDVVYLSNYAILTDPDEETFILSPEAFMATLPRKPKSCPSAGFGWSAWGSTFRSTTTAGMCGRPSRRLKPISRCWRTQGRGWAR